MWPRTPVKARDTLHPLEMRTKGISRRGWHPHTLSKHIRFNVVAISTHNTSSFSSSYEASRAASLSFPLPLLLPQLLVIMEMYGLYTALQNPPLRSRAWNRLLQIPIIKGNRSSTHFSSDCHFKHSPTGIYKIWLHTNPPSRDHSFVGQKLSPKIWQNLVYYSRSLRLSLVERSHCAVSKCIQKYLGK